MAALPASGYLQLGTDGATGRSVNSVFGYGNDMASYQGAFYQIGSSVGQFPKRGNSFGMSSFYSTEKIPGGSRTLVNVVEPIAASGTGSAVTIIYNSTNKFAVGDIVVLSNFKSNVFSSSPINGPQTITAIPENNQFSFSSTETAFYQVGNYSETIKISSIIIPIYGILNVTAAGDQGGSSGNNGINQCFSAITQPSNGSSSNVQTNFGGYVVASSGNGGLGSNLSLNPNPGSYGPIITSQFTNPSAGGSGPLSGARISVSIGPGGTGGLGGPNFAIIAGGCQAIGYAGGGAKGDAGYINISWS